MMKSAKAEILATLARFPSLAWSGRFEVDYLDPQIQKFGGWKERTLFALGWVKADEMATLLLHVHFVLVHRRTRRETISYQLKKVFPAPQQVRVSPLRTNLPLDVSLDNMVRYPLKPSLDPGFLAEKGAENHLPRRPDVVRYFLRMYEALDGRRKPRGMEFDKIHSKRQPHAARGTSDASDRGPRKEQSGSLNCRTFRFQEASATKMDANPLKLLPLESAWCPRSESNQHFREET